MDEEIVSLRRHGWLKSVEFCAGAAAKILSGRGRGRGDDFCCFPDDSGGVNTRQKAVKSVKNLSDPRTVAAKGKD